MRQYRSPAERVLLEVPAGTLDPQPDGSIEDPDLAARRELEEETGYRAASWRVLCRFFTAPGFTTEYMHLYLAANLRPADTDRLDPDGDERLHLVRMPWRDAVAAVERGEIEDAKSIVALLWLARIMANDHMPAPGSAPASELDRGDRVAVEFRLRMADYIRANMALARTSWSSRILGFLPVVAAVLLLIAGSIEAAILLVLLGVVTLSGVWAAPFLWLLLRNRPDMVNAVVGFEASEAGVRISSAFGAGETPWSAFQKATEAGGFIFLDSGAGQAFIVPRSAFEPSQLGTFYRLLDRAGLLAGGRHRR